MRIGSKMNAICAHPAVLAAFAEENIFHREHILNCNKFTVIKSGRYGIVAYAYYPSTCEEEVRDLKFKAALDYWRPCFLKHLVYINETSKADPLPSC